MKGDFSRISFRPERPFTRVLAQQGRVDLDAERNEAQAVVLERLRLGMIDAFGPFGGPRYLYEPGPAWRNDNLGFLVDVERSGGNVTAVKLGAGRYYTAGWACSTGGLRLDSNMDQPALPTFPGSLIANPDFLVYLDVWERLRTNLDDPLIGESALNGIDTCARAELVCQVRFLANGDRPAGVPNMNTFTKANLMTWWPDILQQLGPQNPAMLKVTAERPANASANPCLANVSAGYIGPENQLYRVEIHMVQPGGEVTFKYSRDNAANAAALLDIDGSTLQISGIFEPERGFAGGQWVELTTDRHELLGLPGTLVKVTRVEGDLLTIDPATVDGSLDPKDFPEADHPKVRRWDQTGRGPLTLVDGAVAVEEGKPIALEYGIQVEFHEDMANPHTYRTGDYWTFPARYLTGDVEWPEDAFLPPHGVTHYYAPLAVVTGANVIDLRMLKDAW